MNPRSLSVPACPARSARCRAQVTQASAGSRFQPDVIFCGPDLRVAVPGPDVVNHRDRCECPLKRQDGVCIGRCGILPRKRPGPVPPRKGTDAIPPRYRSVFPCLSIGLPGRPAPCRGRPPCPARHSAQFRERGEKTACNAVRSAPHGASQTPTHAPLARQQPACLRSDGNVSLGTGTPPDAPVAWSFGDDR